MTCKFGFPGIRQGKPTLKKDKERSRIEGVIFRINPLLSPE